MNKKKNDDLVDMINKSTGKIRKAIELDEDAVTTAEKCKDFAQNLLETIEVEKRKLVEVYEFNAEQEF